MADYFYFLQDYFNDAYNYARQFLTDDKAAEYAGEATAEEATRDGM